LDRESQNLTRLALKLVEATELSENLLWRTKNMSDNELYENLLTLSKWYIGRNGLRTLEAEEVANTAYVYVKTGRYGLKEDGSLYYAVQMSCNPNRKDNVHVRSESCHLPYGAASLLNHQDVERADWTELYDEIDNLPYEQSQAVYKHLYGDDVLNKRDLKAGQKAMRDIYGK
jgi:hypothetical protein